MWGQHLLADLVAGRYRAGPIEEVDGQVLRRAPVQASAEERREKAEGKVLPKALGGRKDGREPVRYGDWEKKGIAVDF